MGLGWHTQLPEVVLRPCHVLLAIGSSLHVCLLVRRTASAALNPLDFNLSAKVGSQETPGVTGKFGLGVWNEGGQRLIEFCQENALVIANTLFQQHKRRLHMYIIRWSTPKSDSFYSLQPKMEKLYTVSKNKTGS